MKYQQAIQSIETIISKGFMRTYKDEIQNDRDIYEFKINKLHYIRNWGHFIQVVIYMFYVGVGVFIGEYISLSVGNTNSNLGSVLGLVIFWLVGTYDLVCLTMVQKKFYWLKTESGTFRIWRKGISVCFYGGGDTYIVAKTPVSILYLLLTKNDLTDISK